MKKIYKTPKSVVLDMDIEDEIIATSNNTPYVPIVPDEDAKNRFRFGLSSDDYAHDEL